MWDNDEYEVEESKKGECLGMFDPNNRVCTEQCLAEELCLVETLRIEETKEE